MLWKILPRKSDDLIEQLLINKGLNSEKEKERFFHPKLISFEKDLQIPGISKAIERIKKAIIEGELIIAYGDYDVDGICGAAVLYLGLTSAGAKVLPYIPHREKEGYGLSPQGLDFAKNSGASVVITCDTGIVSFDMADYAKDLGLDLIITDHHQKLGNKLPNAFATVHSLDLCGAGVAWCLVRDLMGKQKTQDLIEFVSIATISDMMPLLGVNRALVVEGLERLNNTKRVGLLALLHESGIKEGEISSYEIGYIIAPRLNAMGRLEHAIDSLRLLCTKDPVKAKKLASLLDETNNRRKELTEEAVEKAKEMISHRKKIHVLSSVDWSSGIIGLIAARICEITTRPTIVISLGDSLSRGSARSANGINIVEAIRQCSDILVAVGGHPGAAGFTIENSKIKEFQKRIEKVVGDKGISGGAKQVLEIDAEIGSNELSLPLAKKLNDFEPFGVGNQRPNFASVNMYLVDVRTVGDGKHLKGKVVDPEQGRRTDGVDFIGFGMGDLINILSSGQLVDLAYTLDVDKFNGFEKLQLKLKDLKIA